MLWGALNNASTAMMAMSTDMGSISQNVANVNTVGYKRTETMFKTVMSEHQASPTTSLAGLNVFGVKATQRNLIEAQGVVQHSNTWSDLAINGKGFFMVAPPVAGSVPASISTDNPQSVLYTRDGQWQRQAGADSNTSLERSYFVGGGGNYLLGWMADDIGNVNTSGPLQPVYTLGPKSIANNGTAAVDPTATISKSQQTMPGRATTSVSILGNLPSDSPVGGNSSTIEVNDGLGNPQTVTLNWTRTTADTWTVTPSSPYATNWSVPSFTVSVDDKGVVTPATAGPQAVDITWDADHGAGVSSTTVDPSSAPVSRGTLQKIPVEVFDSNYNSHIMTFGFERTDTNHWYMYGDPGADGVAPPPVALTFDGNGQLTDPAGGIADVSTSWTSTDVPPVSGTGAMSVNLTKLSQYDGSTLYVGHVDTNGYSSGTLMSTAFTDTGNLEGYYDNGHSRTLFKVAVANFTSENALDPVSGNLFSRTPGAGDITVSPIEDAPGEGRFATSSLESSDTDIQTEFTRMIMTQKAYSTNAQVFKTADEMTTTARDLKR